MSSASAGSRNRGAVRERRACMAKRVALTGVMTALGIVLGWLESLVPFTPGIPGVKLGVANIAALLVLYRLSWKEAATVSILRILISCMLFGNPITGIYSLAGAALSLLIMVLLKRLDGLSMTGVSAAGGVAHNIGQILAAWLLLGTDAILYYLPILLATGVVSGVLIGLAGAWLHRHLPTEIS